MTPLNPILIIGKHGKTGSRVNTLLKNQGIDVRAVSRSTSLSFNWEDQSTWAKALSGTQSAYVTYQPDLALPQAESTIRDFVSLAKSMGVKHIVLLSGRGEAGAQRAENVLIESGLTWNVVRASWFYQNFSESFMAEGIVSGTLALPADGTVEPFVDADDIAEVAVAALTQPELHNRLFEVTGPEALTFAQCVECISKACGRSISYNYVPIDPYIEQLNKQGIPKDYQWLLRELFTEVFDGRNSNVMNGIEDALGRPPRNFASYAAKAAQNKAWTNTDLAAS
ncbi:MAG: NAD(P)H-binding protein [Agarilytica sp.]